MEAFESVKEEINHAKRAIIDAPAGTLVWYYLALAFIKLFSRLVDEIINRP